MSHALLATSCSTHAHIGGLPHPHPTHPHTSPTHFHAHACTYCDHIHPQHNPPTLRKTLPHVKCVITSVTTKDTQSFVEARFMAYNKDPNNNTEPNIPLRFRIDPEQWLPV